LANTIPAVAVSAAIGKIPLFINPFNFSAASTRYWIVPVRAYFKLLMIPPAVSTGNITAYKMLSLCYNLALSEAGRAAQ
jgi:hypothetical protein